MKERKSFVEISDSYLRAVTVLYSKEGVKSLHSRVVHLDDCSSESIGEALKSIFCGNNKWEGINVLKRFNLREVVLVLPSRHFVLDSLSVPSVDDQEISRMVGFYSSKRIPYEASELCCDYLLLDSDDGISNVLGMGIPCEIVEKYIYALQRSGMRVCNVVPSFLGGVAVD